MEGVPEMLADADRPGGWLLLTDRIRQSYVDLGAPTYLEFEYMRGLANVLDALPGKPLTLVHVGGGGLTLPRYVADDSLQVVPVIVIAFVESPFSGYILPAVGFSRAGNE